MPWNASLYSKNFDQKGARRALKNALVAEFYLDTVVVNEELRSNKNLFTIVLHLKQPVNFAPKYCRRKADVASACRA